jgi:hypothetical protein
MMRTLTTWLIVTLAGTALVTGCGSSSTTTSGSQAPAPSTQSTGTGSATGTSTATSPAEQKKSGAQAVASCKSAIHSESSIPASAKTKLEGICEKASGGSKEELQKVAHEECIALVDATPLPNGAAKQRALAICKAPA